MAVETDLEQLADAMEDEQHATYKAASTSTADARHTAVHPGARHDLYHANGRPRTPSQSLHRRNSFDERRIPPTLQEDSSVPYSFDGTSSPSTAPLPGSGVRSCSGTTSSQKLLRRISSDTVQSLDFDSDVGANTLSVYVVLMLHFSRKPSTLAGLHQLLRPARVDLP